MNVFIANNENDAKYITGNSINHEVYYPVGPNVVARYWSVLARSEINLEQ